MGITPQQQQRIIEQESAWIDSSFGGIDLSGYPALNPLPKEDFHDPRFARDYRDTPFSRSAADLRKFLRNPESEALRRAGTESRRCGHLVQIPHLPFSVLTRYPIAPHSQVAPRFRQKNTLLPFDRA